MRIQKDGTDSIEEGNFIQSEAYDRLKCALEEAEAVLVGAGAGLSAAAGFVYTGTRFHKYFQDFIERYHFQDMYSGGFYPFPSLEEHWAYWSRYIYINRYQEPPKPVYNELYELIKKKDYFVLTTNVDHCFQRAGFDKARLFYTQGDFGLWQCSEPCHMRTYDNEEGIRQMVRSQKDMRVLPELVPYCPKCGRPMGMNLRADQTFVEDEGWHLACRRYEAFLEEHRQRRLLLVELGCGMNTPGIIKLPFWKMVLKNKGCQYISINKGEAWVPEEIQERSVCMNEDIAKVMENLFSTLSHTKNIQDNKKNSNYSGRKGQTDGTSGAEGISDKRTFK